ncbi:hypothetical protein [Bradyrhizobium sp. 33ap4]|uniref:hypothetical protein n=1 Tax=Bradyrhizobium sp. 33ap4 TaxID=3061630 RepID=UPI00292DAD1E|nr:hypothetical protein [Bradyrhizobium sp. 33ap4]
MDSIAVPLPAPPYATGGASDLVGAKARCREAWERFYAEEHRALGIIPRTRVRGGLADLRNADWPRLLECIMAPPVTVHFTCISCGIVYSASQERSATDTNTSGTFDCWQCGKLVHHWAGIYDYNGWRITCVLPKQPKMRNEIRG